MTPIKKVNLLPMTFLNLDTLEKLHNKEVTLEDMLSIYESPFTKNSVVIGKTSSRPNCCCEAVTLVNGKLILVYYSNELVDEYLREVLENPCNCLN